jgi:hypothetical protein
MTRNEVVDTVSKLSKEMRMQWLIALGSQLTVSARAYYPLGPEKGDLAGLIAFNELQHQVYNYLRHSRTKDDWTIESFVHGLCDKASASGVDGWFGAALKASVEELSKTDTEYIV